MMILKRTLWFWIIYGLMINALLARERTKPPNFYRCNPSTRFIKFHPLNETGTISTLSKGSDASFQAILPETLKVMAIRVQFQRDNDRNTTGEGWFDLSEGDDMINPPPHNRRYFTNQLRALKDYYDKVSGGKLFLKVEDETGMGFVYPMPADSAWILPHPMSYYNPNQTEALLDQRLAELFQDAITVADLKGEINFSHFDCFIIFHAGVGAEFTQDFDTTPNDIPSVFLNFNDLKKTIGNNSPAFRGIPVNNSTFFVREGIILPETENQAGYTNFGLIGTAALMMGYQLGLPGLFDTDTGHPGIGRFGLMDQGSGNFFGNIPAQPCAWSKLFLGWEQAIVVSSGTQLPVAASLAALPNKIYKIPINAKEYFLIENRQQHVREKRNIGVGYDENNLRIEFYDDGDYNPKTGLGVIVSIQEYDFGLPGSGILIWHVDENVLQEKYLENRVNTDMDHRGVDLVEADGSQDIGYFYNNFGFTGYHAGYAEDMWWNENQVHLYANSAQQVTFTPVSMPNTRTYSGANSGIYITDFSPIDSVMYFTVEHQVYKPGFPAFLGLNSGNSPMVAGDLDGDNQNEILTTTQDGKVLAWQADGEKFIANDDVNYLITIHGDTITLPAAIFAETSNDSLLYSLALADLDHDSDMEVIAGSQKGKVYAWHGTDNDRNGRADFVFEIACGSPITTVPVIGNWNSSESGLEIAIGLANGNLCLIRESGSIIWNKKISTAKLIGIAGFIENNHRGLVIVAHDRQVFLLGELGEIAWQKSLPGSGLLNYPAVGDLDNDNHLEIIITSSAGNLFILNHSGDILPSFSSVSLTGPLSNPTLADLDDNGYLDIVFTGGGKIFAYHFNGTSLTDFPIVLEQGFEQESYPEPILVDLDGDRKVEMFVATMNNQLIALNYRGHRLEPFPLSISQPIIAPPIITTLGDKNKVNLIARSKDNYCYVWQLDYEFNSNQIPWGQYLKDAQHIGLYLETISAPEKQGTLMPEKMVYNYPNPTEGNTTTIRYYLRDEATVAIRIYDATGELVQEMMGPGTPGIENEVNWDLTNVQSGVYLARISAKNKSETNVAIIKIAVLR